MRVLVVDDDIATVEVVRSSVDWEKLGVSEVYTAYNISHAKKILSEREVDIVISDVEMPQGSGIDLLEWIRQRGFSQEFLLLTCHENFEYATKALKNRASEYLVKPFDVNIMEAALKKIILKIREERQMIKASEYGEWAKKNQRQLKLAFWNRILSGHIGDAEITAEIKNKKLHIEEKADYCLVLSRIHDLEKEKMNQGLLFFVLENIHSEILCGNPVNESILSMKSEDNYIITAVCRVHEGWDADSLCIKLQKNIRKVFPSDVTVCMSHICNIFQLNEKYHICLEQLEKNVGLYGTCFHEMNALKEEEIESNLFDLEEMEEILSKKQKIGFLSYLKRHINAQSSKKLLNTETLKYGKAEILQAVYTYLGKRGIQASGLFTDDDLRVLDQKAAHSAVDLIRWANYLAECVFRYEEEMRKQSTISSKIEQYVKEHFRENIGRNEIAEVFHLSPEYLAKTYKKQTGKNLKNYITECRINEAKWLLEQGERVSEVSDAVGFENYTYFSTVFKKNTGMTPNQYRNKYNT